MLHCFAAGNIICSWGRGEDGQLGHGDAEDRIYPTQLNALDDHEVVSVICGADHTIAYSESRLEVYSWGWLVSYFSTSSLKFFYAHHIYIDIFYRVHQNNDIQLRFGLS